MLRLIGNELYKIFHKKSIYIIGIIIFLLVLLNDVLYKTMYDNDGNLKGLASIENYSSAIMKDTLNDLDPNKATDKLLYVEEKTYVDMFELSNKYGTNSWQSYIVNSEMYDVVYNMNYYTYVFTNDELYNENKKDYDYYINYFDKDDFDGFITSKLEEIDKQIEGLKKDKEKEEDKKLLLEIDESLENLEFDRELLNYRKEKQILYGNNYLNDALNEYSSSYKYIKDIDLDNIDKLNYEDKRAYYNNLESYNINKYILENKVNLSKQNTVRNNVISSVSNYEILIVILTIIIAGTIVASEFNKGTIKNLLIRPYSRTKMLLAKFISCLIILFSVIIFVCLCDLVVGGIFFSFDSLKIPVVVYNFTSGEVQEYNVFIYTLITIGSHLPMFLLILSLAFVLGTLTINSQISIALPIVFYMFGEVLNAVAISLDLKWMKLFPTLNWNLEEYLFGKLPAFQYSNFSFAIAISVIYISVMIMGAVILFKRRDIKNI